MNTTELQWMALRLVWGLIFVVQVLRRGPYFMSWHWLMNQVTENNTMRKLRHQVFMLSSVIKILSELQFTSFSPSNIIDFHSYSLLFSKVWPSAWNLVCWCWWDEEGCNHQDLPCIDWGLEKGWHCKEWLCCRSMAPGEVQGLGLLWSRHKRLFMFM